MDRQQQLVEACRAALDFVETLKVPQDILQATFQVKRGERVIQMLKAAIDKGGQPSKPPAEPAAERKLEVTTARNVAPADVVIACHRIYSRKLTVAEAESALRDLEAMRKQQQYGMRTHRSDTVAGHPVVAVVVHNGEAKSAHGVTYTDAILALAAQIEGNPGK